MWIFRKKTDDAETEQRNLLYRVEALEEWATKQERRWNGFIEEAEERIDRGNKQWRRIRAAQRREEVLEESEGESEPHPDLFRSHENGSGAEGVPALPHGMDGRASHVADWEAKKRAVNRALAGFDS